MKKLNHLRQHLIDAIPALQKSPERLLVFVENGSIDSYDGDNLSHKYRFPARLVITDWHEGVDSVIVATLEWLWRHEPGIDPKEIIRFDAEILNHEKVDLSLTVTLTERVIVKKACGASTYTVDHIILEPRPTMDCDADLAIDINGPSEEFTLPETSGIENEG